MKFLEAGRHKRGRDYTVGFVSGDGPVRVYCSGDVKRGLRRILEKTAVAAAAVAAVGGAILLLFRRGRE